MEVSLAASMKKLYLNPEISDVTFIIDGKRLPAHRTILCLNSDYFRGLLFGDSVKNLNEISLSVNLQAFKAILKYIYTRSLVISEYDDELKTEIINLAAEYGFKDLVSQKLRNMSESLNFDNFADILNLAEIHNVKSVYEKTLKFVDLNASTIIKETTFAASSKEALVAIIQRDNFAIDELEIFKAVMKWAEEHSKEDLQDVICHVRFVLMQINEIKKFVEPENLFQPEEIDGIMKDILTLNCLPYRSGKIHRSQMDFELMATSNDYGYTWKNEDKKFVNPMLFKLSSEKTINHIKLLLTVIGNQMCSYYIEVSCDQREWTRVVDYSNFNCYWDQFLYFEMLPVNFIYIVPTCMAKGYFPIEGLEVNYKIVSVPKMVNGFVAPRFNSKDFDTNPYDMVTFDNHSVSTQSFLSEINYYKFSLIQRQPIYVNCLYLKDKDSNCKVSCIEIRDNKNDRLKKIDFQSDWLGVNYFFAPQVVAQAQITLTKEVELVNLSFYYHHGHSSFCHSA